MGVRSLIREDPLEKGMATHSSILAWRIPTDRGAWGAAVHGITRVRRFSNQTTAISPCGQVLILDEIPHCYFFFFFSFYCGTQLQILIIGSSAYRGLERIITFLSFSSNIKLNYLSPSSSNSIGLHKFTQPQQSYCPTEFLASWNVIIRGNSQCKSNRHPPQLKPLSP